MSGLQSAQSIRSCHITAFRASGLRIAASAARSAAQDVIAVAVRRQATVSYLAVCALRQALKVAGSVKLPRAACAMITAYTAGGPLSISHYWEFFWSQGSVPLSSPKMGPDSGPASYLEHPNLESTADTLLCHGGAQVLWHL